jgi:MATE family multidrug resistance protein
VIRQEIRDTLRLAGPVVTTQIGAIAMGLVDTIMVGHLGQGPLSAVALGNSLSFTIIVVGMGILMGLDPMVSQAHGAGRPEDCGRAMRHGALVAAVVTVPSILVLSQARFILARLGQTPDLVENGASFVHAITFGVLPFLLFVVLRQFLQGISRPKAPMTIMILANLLNFAANWVLIYGHFGLPAMGSTGSAWATTISRWAMFLALAAYVFGKRDLRHYAVTASPAPPDRAVLGRLLHLGLPVGLQYGMEVGVFGAASMMMGWIGTLALAGHQIALNLCSVTFMVPLGISSTAAVRVGQALGRGDVHAARRAGFIAYGLGAAFMACSALCFALFPEFFARIYTHDEEVVRMAASLLMVGAAFQLSDAGQTIGIGALRGAADTRVPMLVTIVSYWVVGLPVGWALAFKLGMGPVGLWWGLTCGLTLVAVTLVLRFHLRVREERLARLQVLP